MQVICDHAGTEHCKKVLKKNDCTHHWRHEKNAGCSISFCTLNKKDVDVKCIPYQEERK
jgi:hypothetical protein